MNFKPFSAFALGTLLSLSPALVWASDATPKAPGSPAPAAPVEVVQLTFNWPANLKGSAQFKNTKTILRRGKRSEQTFKAEQPFNTAAHAQGLLMTTGEMKVELVGDGMAGNPKLQKFLTKLASVSANYVISKDGTITDLIGLDQLIAKYRASFEGMLSDLPDAHKTHLSQLYQTVLSPAGIRQSIEQQWNTIVGTWVEASFEKGETYVAEFSQPIPVFGNNTVIPMTTFFEYVGRVPCGNGSKKQCVELYSTTQVDQEKLQEVLKEFMKKLLEIAEAQGGPVFELKELEQTSTIRLITEADTLIPHYLETQDTSSTIIAVEGVEDHVEQIKKKTVTYQYES